MSPRIKSDSPPLPVSPKRLLRFRPRAWLSVVALIALAIGAHFLWVNAESQMAHDPHYALTLDKIHITPQPPWIRSDIKSQALRDANLVGALSVLDDWETLSHRVKDAFEFHPWVASVTRITRHLPSSLEVELAYRKPIAAVESSDTSGVMFLPIDERAVRLPEGDLTEAERRYLPRISGITGRPLVGDRWDDPRVVGGAKLASQLADVWQKLRLVEIVANLQSSTRDEKQVYRYEIVTTGGTRIVWGMMPGDESATGESPFGQKRQRLLDYAAQHGKLESIDGPAVLDVRSEVVITPRTARNKSTAPKEDATQTK
jgi:hypothetical protein